MAGQLRSGQGSCGCKPAITLINGACVELIRSRTVRANHTGGMTGVEWMPNLNKWKAVIHFKGKRHYLGLYGRFEDAVKARQRGEEEYFKTFLAAYSQPSGGPKGAGERQ